MKYGIISKILYLILSFEIVKFYKAYSNVFFYTVKKKLQKKFKMFWDSCMVRANNVWKKGVWDMVSAITKYEILPQYMYGYIWVGTVNMNWL